MSRPRGRLIRIWFGRRYNKNLAATFREVAEHGKDGYYKGRIAKEIVKVLAGESTERRVELAPWKL